MTFFFKKTANKNWIFCLGVGTKNMVDAPPMISGSFRDKLC